MNRPLMVYADTPQERERQLSALRVDLAAYKWKRWMSGESRIQYCAQLVPKKRSVK